MNPHKHIRDNYDCSGNLYVTIKDFVRRDLYILFNKLGYWVGAEIGVRLGNNAVKMFRAMPESKIYLIDPYLNYSDYINIDDDSDQGWYLAITRMRTKKYDAEIMRMFSADAAENFGDNSLDFVYIDGNHDYEYVMLDLMLWYNKVRQGGILSGHDFINRESDRPVHVKQAVEDFVRANGIKRVYLTDSTVPDDGTYESKVDREAPSWFMVKGG